MKKRLKQILKENKKTGKQLSKEIGMSYDHFRKGTMNKGNESFFWVKAFVIGYEMGKLFNVKQK